MPSQWKLTQVFDAGGNGWTESLWYESPAILPVLADLQSLIKLRLALGSPNLQMLGMRVTELVSPFRSLLFGQSLGVGPGTAVLNSVSAPWLGLQVEFESGLSVYKVNLELRGWPVSQWDWAAATPHTGVLGGLLAAPFRAWGDYLTKKEVPGVIPAVGAFIGRSRSAAQLDRQTTKITALASAGKGEGWQVTLENAFPLAVGDTFAMTRVRGGGTSGANGTATVKTVVTPGTVYLTTRVKTDDCPIDYAKTGWAFKLVRFNWPYAKYRAVEWVKRDEGRPIGPTRGRRRAAV